MVDSIFVAGGFAEVTPARCTVLAEQAQPVSEIDRNQVQQDLSDAKDDLLDAKDDMAKRAAEKKLAIAEAMLKVVAA